MKESGSCCGTVIFINFTGKFDSVQRFSASKPQYTQIHSSSVGNKMLKEILNLILVGFQYLPFNIDLIEKLLV